VRNVWRDRWVFDNCIAFWLEDGEDAFTLATRLGRSVGGAHHEQVLHGFCRR
jgi:hypothetical protein